MTGPGSDEDDMCVWCEKCGKGYMYWAEGGDESDLCPDCREKEEKK